MAAVIDDPNEQEEGPRRNSVIQHLVDRAFQSLYGKAEDAQNDESQMADRRVRHELLHVGLNHCDKSAIDDSHDREHGNQRREKMADVRSEEHTSELQSL